MPFFQPVKPGEPVTHSARRENAISSMLNTFSDLSACGAKPGAGTAFRIAVCNQTAISVPAEQSPAREPPSESPSAIRRKRKFPQDAQWSASRERLRSGMPYRYESRPA